MKINHILLDCDGCLTDGSKTLDKNGQCISKIFYDENWTIIKRLKASELSVLIVSGDEWNRGVFESRGINFIYGETIGDSRKLLKIKELGIDPETCVYLGDSIYDLELLQYVKYPYCPFNSDSDITPYCTVLPVEGGKYCLTALYEDLIRKGLVAKMAPIEG